MLLSSFYVKIFSFPTYASNRSKYPLGDTTKRLFQHCSLKWKVQLCELNAHITKQSLRMLLSSLYVKICLLQSIPQRAPNIHKQILQKQCFKTAISKESFNYVKWTHISPRSFWECFCLLLMEDISFSTTDNKALQMNTCRFHKKCVSTLLNQKKRSSLWVECTHHKAVSENASVLFLCEDISFFIIGLKSLQIFTCRHIKKTVSKQLSQKEGSTLWVDCTHHKAVSENTSVQFEYEDISFSIIVIKSLQISTCRYYKKTVSKLLSVKGGSILSVECTHYKAVSENASG